MATVNVGGTCAVNGFPADIVFASEVVVTPEPGSTFDRAGFAGPFTVSPDAP